MRRTRPSANWWPTRRTPARAWAATRTAAGHMQQIADPLAEAIVKQFPDRYRG